MLHWTRRLIIVAAALSLTGCLWGPGKFASDLTLRKDGSFILDYRGEIVLQMPDDQSGAKNVEWNDSFARCYLDGRVGVFGTPDNVVQDDSKTRPCSSSELAKAKADFEKAAKERGERERKSRDEMAKAFGLTGVDDASNRAFAAKLMKYEGWRSVTYRGKGVFDVDYHFEGRATQDFFFPMLPDNDLLIPFVATRRRADGAVLVTAPAFTGGSGALAARAGAAASQMKDGPVSRAQGRFTVITDGEILTNNSEDGPQRHNLGREVHWDVGPGSSKIPETLVRLQ